MSRMTRTQAKRRRGERDQGQDHDQMIQGTTRIGNEGENGEIHDHQKVAQAKYNVFVVFAFQLIVSWLDMIRFSLFMIVLSKLLERIQEKYL